MTGSVAIFYDKDFIKYDLGRRHPLHQERILLHYELSKALNMLSAPGVSEPKFDPASDEQLQYVHTKGYIDQVKTLSEREDFSVLDRGDTSAFPGAYNIAKLMVGATLAGVDYVMNGLSQHSWSPGGGFHHAHADAAAGFCIFNDVAIACHYLKQKYNLKRILYFDIDVHHADGVQEQFYNDPRVLTLSIHETGRTLFPGTGYSEEIGQGDGLGYTVNLPLPPYTQDYQYLQAFEAIVPPIIKAYEPEAIVMQNGVDTHFQDELGHLVLTTETFDKVSDRIHTLAHQYSKGRLIAVGGGGYSYYSVPRCWTIILAKLIGYDIPDIIPKEWQHLFTKITGLKPPTNLYDKEKPHIPVVDQDRVERIVNESVNRVKNLIFPLLSIEK